MTERDSRPEDPEDKRHESAGSPLGILLGLAVMMGLVILYGALMD